MVLALLVLPLAGAFAYRLRRRAVGRRSALAEVGLIAGSVPWAVMLFTPQPAPRSIDLIPLHDVPSWLTGGIGTAAAQVTGNLLVLAAVGFFLPMRFAFAGSLPRIAGVAVVTSSVIEALQWVLDIGRVSSVDDVLINTVGAVVAAVASRRWWVGRCPDRELRPSAAEALDRESGFRRAEETMTSRSESRPVSKGESA